jgi:hypothetical protein
MNWKNRFFNYFLIIATGLSLWVLIREASKDSIDLSILVSSSAFALALTISLVFYNRKAFRKEEKYLVRLEENKISCLHPEKPNESVFWDEISEVVVLTTDKGPYEPYIWILLTNDQGKGCVFPLGAKNSRKAIEKILGFQGLDLSLWAEALKSTENRRFVVWSRAKLKA